MNRNRVNKKNRKLSIVLIILLVSILLMGCSKADIEGIVLEVTQNQIMMPTKLLTNEYGNSDRGLIRLT